MVSNQLIANEVAVAGDGADAGVGGSSGFEKDKPGIDVGRVTEGLFYAHPSKPPEVQRDLPGIRKSHFRVGMSISLMRLLRHTSLTLLLAIASMFLSMCCLADAGCALLNAYLLESHR